MTEGPSEKLFDPGSILWEEARDICKGKIRCSDREQIYATHNKSRVLSLAITATFIRSSPMRT